MQKIAVHLHLYYTEQLSDIIKYLENLSDFNYDLYVTLTQKNAFVMSQIRSVCPDAKFWVIENRGYDVGAFIYFLQHIRLENYDFILKLHTKSKHSDTITILNKHRVTHKIWGEILWQSLLGSAKQISDNLQSFATDPTQGMIGSKYCLTADKNTFEEMLPEINRELFRQNFQRCSNLSFVAGTMFMVRAELLRPLLIYTNEDFAMTDIKVKDKTLAHILERVIGAVVCQQGYKINPCPQESVSSKLYFYHFGYSLARFLLQIKKTSSQKLLIKVCKIPVYSHSYIKE